MFCSNCGKEIPDNVAFCPVCGTKTLLKESTEPVQPKTKEGWMLLAIKDAIASTLKDPYSVKYGSFEKIDIDEYGRTYAEIIVHGKNSYGAYVPSRYAVGFYDVTENAPCKVIPKSLYLLPPLMVGAQRMIAKKLMKFGSPNR